MSQNNLNSAIDKYNDIIMKKANKQNEIETLKNQIKSLEMEIVNLNNELIETDAQAKIEIYTRYSKKYLLSMASRIHELSDNSVFYDFKDLVKKHELHTLNMEDIMQLNTYVKIYQQHLEKPNTIIKTIFKALGGKNIND